MKIYTIEYGGPLPLFILWVLNMSIKNQIPQDNSTEKKWKT